jgi:hypothetical protein
MGVQLLGYELAHRNGGYAPRLGDADHAARVAGLVEYDGYLGGLA